MKDADTQTARCGQWLLWVIGALFLTRLASLGLYPLTDTTEARYADIARRMLQTGDWVTPWFAEQVPFWGKPPLSFWATALSFKIFGVNETAARLPHLMFGGGVAWLVWQHARQASHRAAWFSVATLAGSFLFFVSSGAVMTDMALTVGTTLVMVGFWRAFRSESLDIVAICEMTVGISVGLLAKGPVSLILWGLPITLWAASNGYVIKAWKQIPWLRIAIIVLVVTVPWYILAEARTPGFLQYFIIGEHWHRFLTPGWSGDLYGSAHKFKRGAIWLFAVGAVMPWPLIAAAVWFRSIGSLPGNSAAPRSNEFSYLLAWMLAPCLFFTLSANILWPYVLPGIPAFAVVLGYWLSARSQPARVESVVTLGLIGVLAVMAGGLAWAQKTELFDQKSAKSLIQEYKIRAKLNEPLYFLGAVPSSGYFYSDGNARSIDSISDLPAGQAAFLILNEKSYQILTPDTRAQTSLVMLKGQRVLLQVPNRR